MFKIIKKCWKALCSLFRWYIGMFRGRPWYVKTIMSLLSFFLFFIIYLGMVDVNFLWLFGSSPGINEIRRAQVSEASEIYSADGVLIGKFFNENRTPVSYAEVCPAFWKALVDTEDERFYSHRGVDIAGLGGALKDMLLHQEARGASTITQQLAKNMFRTRKNSTGLLANIPGLRMLITKTKEWIIAFKIEYWFSKDDILTMYANTVDFGSNAFGIKTASKTYFNTTPADLTTEQAAVLVGMLKATTFYNPISHPDNALKRRNVVLANMRRKDHLSKAECDSLQNIPINLKYSVETNYDGQAKYFRESVAQYLQKWCDEEKIDLYTSGLKIYTTLDTRLQKYAEQAAREQMRTIQQNFNNHWKGQEPWRDETYHVIPGFIEGIAKKLPVYEYLEERFPGQPDSVKHYLNLPHKVRVFDYDKGSIEMEMSTMDSIRYMVSFMHCAFVAMEPQTGHVKAWVGDVDFDSWKYDKVTAQRQPGSTFKLFVYAEAMRQGLTPCDKRRDEYISIEVYDRKKQKTVLWTPNNADGRFSCDSVPLKAAFAKSINSIAVRLGQEMGIRNIISTAEMMGIKSPLENAPSLALGSSDVNLLELVNAYCCVAAGGRHAEPILVEKILNRDGKEIYIAPSAAPQVIPYRTAFLTQQLLLAGLREPGGTSQSLNHWTGGFTDTDFGGKTGTSNNHSDAWFVAVSPNLVAGAWVGGEYRCIHFRTGQLGQGSRTALPICGQFLYKTLADRNFRNYHARFLQQRDPDITPDLYSCASYIPQVDTLLNDTLDIYDETEEFDEDGLPINRPKEEEEEDEKDLQLIDLRLEDL